MSSADEVRPRCGGVRGRARGGARAGCRDGGHGLGATESPDAHLTGQRVSFINLTGAAVTIDSVGRPVFGDLALAPGADGERRFGRAGRYRFTAAGRGGAVIVRAPAPSPSPGGGGSGSPRPGGAGCDRRTVYRYDITVKGRKSVRETWRPEFRNLGDFSISYTYIVTYPGVRLGVTRTAAAARPSTFRPAAPRRLRAPARSSATPGPTACAARRAAGRPPAPSPRP